MAETVGDISISIQVIYGKQIHCTLLPCIEAHLVKGACTYIRIYRNIAPIYASTFYYPENDLKQE